MSIHIKSLTNGRPIYEVKLRTPEGRQHSRSFRTRKQAEAFQVTERAAQLRGTWIDPKAGRVRFDDYAATWVDQRALRPRTRDLYDYLLRRLILPEFAYIELSTISPARVRAWNSALHQLPTIGESTVAKAYRLLRTILATATNDDLIPKNPCTVKGASVEHHDERPVATVAQIDTLAGAVHPRYRAMVLLAAWAGMRFGELAGLRTVDIDPVAGTVRVIRQLQESGAGAITFGPPKTAAGRRTITIPPHVLPVIATHLDGLDDSDPEALVFPSPDGTPLRRSNFNRRFWQPACTSAGITGFHFHDLRHSGNTLAETGASTKELMARMGHASVRAALIYQHATAERDQALAAALSHLAQPERARIPHTTKSQPPCSMDVRSTPRPLSNVTPLRDKPLVSVVETMGLEPTTPCLQSRCSAN